MKLSCLLICVWLFSALLKLRNVCFVSLCPALFGAGDSVRRRGTLFFLAGLLQPLYLKKREEKSDGVESGKARHNFAVAPKEHALSGSHQWIGT